MSVFDEACKFLGDHVADVVFPPVHGIALFLLHVEADDGKTRFRLFHGQGKADVAETDDAYTGGLSGNFFQ
ncbi:hypothetical protein SDC9_176149 [bioreactor metagenome]|uniref:Uncharacterized protein n=1 Tax=bioreactor metagenome TaxID=1076179 RepID=A0A645GXF4_9ZZZZ